MSEHDEQFTEESCGCRYDEIAGRYVRYCREHEPARIKDRLRRQEERRKARIMKGTR